MIMGVSYPMLTYRGHLRPASTERLEPGRLLGVDEVGRMYEVIDSQAVDEGCGVSEHEGMGDHTHVFLQYATPEAITTEITKHGQPVVAGTQGGRVTL